jgi:hypothetical protein
VVVSPGEFAGFASFNGDELVLMKVKTNVPFSYHAGAGWSKGAFFKEKNDWHDYLKQESKNVKFQ